MVTLAELFNFPKLVFSSVKRGNIVYLEGLLLGWKMMHVLHLIEYGLHGWKLPESEGGGRMGPSKECLLLTAVVLKPEWSTLGSPRAFKCSSGPTLVSDHLVWVGLKTGILSVQVLLLLSGLGTTLWEHGAAGDSPKSMEGLSFQVVRDAVRKCLNAFCKYWI